MELFLLLLLFVKLSFASNFIIKSQRSSFISIILAEDPVVEHIAIYQLQVDKDTVDQ